MHNLYIYQLSLTIIIITMSYLIVSLLGASKRGEIGKVTLLFLWHTIFSLVYYYYSLYNVADATLYYSRSITGERSGFMPGTPFVILFTSLTSRLLDATYLNSTLQFNFFGTLGLVFLYLSLREKLNDIPRYWILVLFIPSMSFWSAGLGKDSISYMASCLFIYAVTTSSKPLPLVITSFFFMFMVRPHIAAIFLVSYVVFLIIKSKTHILLKLMVLPIIAASIFFSLSFVQQYVGLEDASVASVSSYIDGRQSVNQSGGSSLDIASMSYPMQMFTYIFRPLPFEAHNIVSLISSLENTLLLSLFLYILLRSKSSLKVFFENKNLWLFTYAFLTCTILAVTTANLGIATRQKWMFMPVLIYLLIYALHDYKTKQYKVYS